MDIQLFLDYSDSYSPASALLIYYYYKKHLPVRYHYVYVYLFASAVVFTISNLLADRHIQNLFIYHFYTVFDFLSFSFLIQKDLKKTINKKLLSAGVFLFLAFLFVNYTLWENFNKLNRNAFVVSGFLISFYCMLFFLDLINSDDPIDLTKDFSFWFFIGFFIYASTCFFVFYFYDQEYFETQKTKNLLWLIQDIALVIKYFLITKALLCQVKK